MKYGKLTILKTWKKKRNTRGYREIAECICDCGGKSTVQVENLKSGHTTSCGCEKIRANTTHGYAHHPAYTIREGMMERCYNPKSKAFKYYGGRGIEIYDEWKNNPGSFVVWAIANGYKKGLSIERIRVNGNYEPSNCVLIEKNLQQKNTRKTMRLTRDGVTDTQRGWAKRLGLHPATFRYQMKIGIHFFGSSQPKQEKKEEDAL